MKDEKEYLRRHWILWNWLAEHPGCRYKHYAFIDLEWDSVSFGCFLCELFHDHNNHCPQCPLQKASGGCELNDGKQNYYDRWKTAQTDKTRRKYAILIRDVVPKPEDQP